MKAHVIRAAWYGLGAIALILAAQGQALAGEPHPVPEIDGGTLSAGIGLLAAGAMIVRSRMQSK